MFETHREDIWLAVPAALTHVCGKLPAYIFFLLMLAFNG
jgi:hypothetical protein